MSETHPARFQPTAFEGETDGHQAVHPTKVKLRELLPPDVCAGTDITLAVAISCPCACDLRGRSVCVVGPKEGGAVAELAVFDGIVNCTKDFTVKAPIEVGEHSWTILFVGSHAPECIHEESRQSISFRTKPHSTGVAVWDIPNSVVMGNRFRVNVGAKCSAGCRLTGSLIEVADQAGTTVATARLGDTPWAETDCLSWIAVDLTAPFRAGVQFWTARVGTNSVATVHEQTSATFSCRITAPPEHTISIYLVAHNTRLPVRGAEVRVGPYEGVTNEHGVATIEAASGTYGVSIRKEGFTVRPQSIDITRDIEVALDALPAATNAQAEAPVGVGHPYAD